MAADFLDKERFEKLRVESGVSWGRPLRLHDSTPSTNDLALEAAQGNMKTGGLFVAREQTDGRGRRGNPWQSPAGENLTFTILVRYPAAPQTAQTYSLVVGLAVRAAVASRLPVAADSSLNEAGRVAEQTPSEAGGARVKWPNDVYVGDKKIAGILVESRVRGADVSLAVGIGLNVLTRDFGPFADERTSLALALDELRERCEFEPSTVAPPELEKESLLVDVLRELEARTRLFVGSGLDALLPELERYDLLRERYFSVDGVAGIGAGIDPSGRLLFQPDGSETVRAIDAGTIALFPRPPSSGS